MKGPLSCEGFPLDNLRPLGRPGRPAGLLACAEPTPTTEGTSAQTFTKVPEMTLVPTFTTVPADSPAAHENLDAHGASDEDPRRHCRELCKEEFRRVAQPFPRVQAEFDAGADPATNMPQAVSWRPGTTGTLLLPGRN